MGNVSITQSQSDENGTKQRERNIWHSHASDMSDTSTSSESYSYYQTMDEKTVFPDSDLLSIAVIGAGAFGTALSQIAAVKGNKVKIYARNPQVVNEINTNHRNPQYLSEFTLSENITATASIEEALKDVAYCILAIPTQIVPGWLLENKDLIPPTLLLCNTAKGLYLQDSCLVSEAVNHALERDQPYAILSGPSFAKEMMIGYPTAVVIASKQLPQAVVVQKSLSSLSFRCYTSHDVIGVELGGALKNPLAIGAGMIEGCGFGINTMAFFLTRSSLELQSLVSAMGGRPETVSGLSGVGDLMLTAFGDLSRNRAAGVRISKGESAEDITKEMTVEGIPTAKVAALFAERCGLTLPLFTAVDAIIAGKLTIDKAQEMLMGRPPSHEFRGHARH